MLGFTGRKTLTPSVEGAIAVCRQRAKLARVIENGPREGKEDTERWSYVYKEQANMRSRGLWVIDCFFETVAVHTFQPGSSKQEELFGDDAAVFTAGAKLLPPLAHSPKEISYVNLEIALEKVVSGKITREDVWFFMAFGAAAGLWFIDTPRRMGFSQETAERLAKEGLIILVDAGRARFDMFRRSSGAGFAQF